MGKALTPVTTIGYIGGSFKDENELRMKKTPKQIFLGIVAVLCLIALPLQAHAKPVKASKEATKERLVLMPLRLSEEDKNLQGAMEAALVKGLQQKYAVFSGEQVAKKAREIFLKESRNTAHTECDEIRCLQGIAEAFQAELLATANITKQDGGYFIALSIQNLYDNKVVQSESVACEGCNAFKVVEKLKEIVGIASSVTTVEESQVKVNPETHGALQLAGAQSENMADGFVMVRIPGKSYEMGKFDVTQAQWHAVMGANPSHFKRCGDTCPVENVSWNDVQVFLQKLNAKTGRQYRLPNEEEWEYACYGGSKTEFCGGSDLNSVAWYKDNSNGSTHPVGQKQANGYGLYDMSGNVWQWMENESGSGRALRGGSWNVITGGLLASFSFDEVPTDRLLYVGFRLARTLQ